MRAIPRQRQCVAGQITGKRKRFGRLTGANKRVSWELEAKARALAGFKAYVTNIVEPTPELVIAAYGKLYQTEKEASGWPNQTWPLD
jgi:hypothetical protein